MRRRRSGFTLVELLVVVGIIAVLVGILLPVLSSARTAAGRVRAMSDLRQVMFAYLQYATANQGALLFGYSPGSVNGVTLWVGDGTRHFRPPVGLRYPWRLAPYLNDAWDVLYSANRAPPRPTPSDSDSVAFMKAYMLSISPDYGINAVFVGGYFSPIYRGFIERGTTAVPNTGRHVVFRDVEVRRPSRLIVFTEVRRHGGGMGHGGGAVGYEGHFWATPPRAAGHMWRARGDGFEVLDEDRVIGLPKGRYGDRTVTAFFDGHVAALTARELDDMTLWANDATDNYYDIPCATASGR